MWNLISVHLDTVLDRCTVCVEYTIGLEIILEYPMDLLGDVGHVESRFSLFGYSASVDAR